MSIADLLSLIIDNLSRRKGRVALTAVGVVIGTTAVVILVSLGAGLQKDARERFGSVGDLTIVHVWPGFMGPGPAGGEPAPALITNQTIAEISAIPGVAAVVPQDGIRGWAFLSVGQLEGGGQILGLPRDALQQLGYSTQGGMLELERGTAVVGSTVPNQFYSPRPRPGQEPPPPPELVDRQVTMVLVKQAEDGVEVRKKVRLRIVGMLREVGDEPDFSIYLPIEDVDAHNAWLMGKRINHDTEGYNGLKVKASKLEDVVDIKDQIVAMGYSAYTQQDTVESVTGFFTILQVVFGGVGAISLLVAAIGIANTMAMAILERTREIGLMKAVGATNRHVLSVFLGEAAGIGFLGGLGGVTIGWGLGQVLNVLIMAYLAGQSAQTGAPPPTVAVYTPLWLPIFALVFSTIIGFLSGLYPALSAATLAPVTALKYE